MITDLERVIFVRLHERNALEVVRLAAGRRVLFRKGLKGRTAGALTFCNIGGERCASWSGSTESTRSWSIR